MPAPTNPADFLEMVRKSGLVPEDRLSSAVLQMRSPQAGIDQLASALVQAGLLTRFQVKQVKQGRYKRFTLAEKYRLLELLGVGGMGAVYLCEHAFMHRLVAVKVLPVDKIAADPTALQRFYREARAVAALDHPNIVRAYDIDKYEGLHFFVMEYVDGTSLQEIVARYALQNQTFDPSRAAHYIAQAAAGLQHAADLGLIHRDIKPGNLLLDRNGTVKVLDMGLARFFDHRHDGLTQKFDDNTILGTADYLSPEQAINDVVDIRADIYGLGGTLYFMLTGVSPFPDGSIAQKLLAHQTQEPKSVREFRQDVPAELLAVLHKMMRKNPDARYQTPDEIVAALAPWTEQPIGPPPDREMPDLCPAVAVLNGVAPGMNIRGSTAKLLLTGSRSAIRMVDSTVLPGAVSSEAKVQTARNVATTPIRTPARPASESPSRLPQMVVLGAATFASVLALLAAAGYLILR